jgi:hypothetical protein
MPLLFAWKIVGWVNVKMNDGKVEVRPGFVRAPLTGLEFRRGFDAETARMQAFLGSPDEGA